MLTLAESGGEVDTSLRSAKPCLHFWAAKANVATACGMEILLSLGRCTVNRSGSLQVYCAISGGKEVLLRMAQQIAARLMS